MVKAAEILLVGTAEAALEAFICLIEAIIAEADVGDRDPHTTAIAPFGVGEERFRRRNKSWEITCSGAPHNVLCSTGV